jgi:hypothetical protein
MDNSESNRAIRDAVQTTLNQFAETVSAGFDGFRAQLEQEQTARTLLTEQVQVLATMIQQAGSGAASEDTLQQLAEVNRQDKVERDLKDLRTSLEKFDSQAARMVSHFVEVTTSLTERVDSSVSGINQNVDERVAGFERRIDDEVGQRIADIDAYIGRVSVGLDESITVLNDRIASSDGRFGTYDDKLNALAKALLDVDAEAFDELKDRVRSVAGEAELVRIEMERFQASMGETVDKTKLRLTEVETQLQDQAMDTETAVQLERLEEVERALIALDPSQFVRVDGSKNARAVVGGYGAASEPPAPIAPAPIAPAADYSTEFPMAPLTEPLVHANGGPRSDSFAPPARARP